MIRLKERHAITRQLSESWFAGKRRLLDDIAVDADRCPLTFAEFTLREFERDMEGNWTDEIPDGNDRSIDAVRDVVMDDVLRG